MLVGVLVGLFVGVGELVGVMVAVAVGILVGVSVLVGVGVGSRIRPASSVRMSDPGTREKKSLWPVIGSTSLSVAWVAPGACCVVNACAAGSVKTST